MGIKTGIGVGAAQVFDTSSVVNTYAKLLQKKQQDEAKFQTEVADLISKVDTKGVRDIDKAEIAKMYSATKDLYAQAAATKNFQEKALLKAKISKAVSDINEYAARSVDFIKKYANQGEDMLRNPWAYDPKVLQKFEGLKNKSLIEMGADAALNPMDYQKLPNPKSREDAFDNVFKDSENFAKPTRINTGGGFYQPAAVVSDEKIAEGILNRLVQYPEYKELAIMTLKKSNPDAASLDKDAFGKALIANELALYKETKGNIYKEKDRPLPKPDKGEKETVSDQYAATLNSLFVPGADKERAKRLILAQSKGLIADLVESGTGWEVVPMKIVKDSKGRVVSRKPDTKNTVFAGSSTDLAGILGTYKVGSSGFGAIAKLKDTPASQSNVLRGTTKELQDAAFKMGMKKEAYKKYLQSKGYKVIEE